MVISIVYRKVVFENITSENYLKSRYNMDVFTFINQVMSLYDDSKTSIKKAVYSL